MTVEAVVAYLGTVLAGCEVVGIADSFAAAEIAMRLRIAKAKAIFTQVPMCTSARPHWPAIVHRVSQQHIVSTQARLARSDTDVPAFPMRVWFTHGRRAVVNALEQACSGK